MAEPSDAQKSEFAKTYGGTAVKILQFYARDGAITDGQNTITVSYTHLDVYKRQPGEWCW